MKYVLICFSLSIGASAFAGECKTSFANLVVDSRASPDRRAAGTRLYELIEDAEKCEGKEIGALLEALNAERRPTEALRRTLLCKQVLALDARPESCGHRADIDHFYDFFRVLNLTPDQERGICRANLGLKYQYAERIADSIQSELKGTPGFRFASGGIESPGGENACPEVRLMVVSASDIAALRATYGERIRGAKTAYIATGSPRAY